MIDHKALISTLSEMAPAMSLQQQATRRLSAGDEDTAQEKLIEATQVLQTGAVAFRRFCESCPVNEVGGL